jgi:hypothetical protein
MNRNRYIFYSAFGVYQLLVFIFTVVIDANSNLLFNMVPYISWFKYGALLGLVLFVVDFFWMMRSHRTHTKDKESMRHENNTLKAKVYDLQQVDKTPVRPAEK